MAELTITKKNFESEVINSDIPVLLDFWAAGAVRAECWLRHFRIAEDYAGKVKVGKVNVDEDPSLQAHSRYQVFRCLQS